MALSSHANNKRAFTLIELTVAMAVTALLLTILCQIYLLMVQEWDREQGEAGALTATSRACDAISKDVSQAVGAQVLTRFSQADTLFFTLPDDQSNNIYVPAWSSNKLQYVSGSTEAYYLSDASGSYSNSGNILWRGLVMWNGENPVVTPDPTWDANVQRGRISPLNSISFSLDDSTNPHCAYVTLVSSYQIPGSNIKQLSRQVTVYLRNAN